MVAFTWLVVALAVLKAPAAWRTRRIPASRSFTLAFVAVTVSMVSNQPVLYERLGEVTGLANLGNLVSYGLGLVSAAFLQAFLLHTYQPDLAQARVRRIAAVTCVVLVLLTTCYVAGPLRDVNSHTDTHVPADSLGDLGFRLSFAAWACWALPSVVVLAVRFARRAASPALRAGLGCVAAGALLVMVRAVGEYGPYAVATWQATSQSETELRAIFWANVAALAGMVLIVVGFTLPTLARRASDALAWLGTLAAFVRLRPLWRLTRGLSTPSPRPLRGARLARGTVGVGLEARLYRRVIEIRDGLLVLARHRDAELEARLAVEAARRGLTGRQARAFVDAGAVLAAARTEAPLAPEAEPFGDAEDLPGEVGYLVSLATGLRFHRDGPHPAVEPVPALR